MNFIELAFEEALSAVGISFPNPAVGAVVVNNGTVVGRGHTQVVHGSHAEVMALRDAGVEARGATLYVTLEPCCHFGRTPPCTNAIIAAGIRNVFFAHRDPNPLVFGKSEKILSDAGIDSRYVKPPENFLSFYEAYDYFVRNNRTFVECKIAESADGFIASSGGSPVRITGCAADEWTARWRRSAEYILVGGGTANLDNPRLTVRGVSGNSPEPFFAEAGNSRQTCTFLKIRRIDRLSIAGFPRETFRFLPISGFWFRRVLPRTGKRLLTIFPGWESTVWWWSREGRLPKKSWHRECGIAFT